MRFNKHFQLKGLHATLSASKPAWLRYENDEQFEKWVDGLLAAQKGTELHALAAECIRLKRYLEGDNTLAAYVRDAIDFNMSAEQTLFYSPNAFGTADAISFEDNFLRIHDLKTGKTHASEEQLYIYAALFCLEYREKPKFIDGEIRIYQNDDVLLWPWDVERVHWIMGRIIAADAQYENILLNRFGR